jgi:hypothetical protein
MACEWHGGEDQKLWGWVGQPAKWPLLAGRPGELDPIRATGRGKAMQAKLMGGAGVSMVIRWLPACWR